MLLCSRKKCREKLSTPVGLAQCSSIVIDTALQPHIKFFYAVIFVFKGGHTTRYMCSPYTVSTIDNSRQRKSRQEYMSVAVLIYPLKTNITKSKWFKLHTTVYCHKWFKLSTKKYHYNNRNKLRTIRENVPKRSPTCWRMIQPVTVSSFNQIVKVGNSYVMSVQKELQYIHCVI